MKLAWLFPGQGSQEVGMGRAMAEASPAARAVFEAADDALGIAWGSSLAKPLSALCFEGPLETLTLTTVTQPAILTTSSAIVAAIRERDASAFEPAYAAGHSLGEYSALVAAGVLDLGDAVRLCRSRGAAMQESVPPGEGAMAAIMGLDPPALAALCEEVRDGQVVGPANFNAPGQIVIAGHAAAVQRASEKVASRGGKAIPLKVSAPFHSALMRPAAERLAPDLAAIAYKPFRFPVIVNVDGTPNTDPSRVADILVRQIDGPVEWVKSIERMAAEGVTHALEIGPGKVLAGLVKRIAKQIKVLSVSDPTSLDKIPEFLAG